MAGRDSPRGLLGRRSDCETLDRLLRSVRSGQSRVLVLRGEAGIGKTALLDYVAGRASGCRVVRADGVQAEMELPFAAVHQLCGRMLDGADGLPGPQRDALREAFGLQDGGAPDHFLVALAVLSLLAAEAEARPLVCLIDDAQWLDRASAQALAFVARRLLAERIAMVFAVREPSEETQFRGLPEMLVEGLQQSDARALLGAGLRGRLDERVRDRIVAETRGNPLALLELPRGLTAGELAGGFGLPAGGALLGRIERSFLRRYDALPPDSQRLVLTAAAEPVGDVPLLWRAIDRLGIAPDAIGPAESTGLIEIGARVRFRHPLVRSAIYRAAAAPARQQVHQALAEATDAHVDPDRRGWHRAHATAGLDEEVARELELSADRAKGRGGLAAAAAFLERAAELSPDPAHRGARALAAAQAKVEAGEPEAADALLSTAELAPLDELQRARLQLLRARIVFAVRHGSDAPSLLLDAARRLVGLDAALAREACLEALAAAMFADRVDDMRDVVGIARDTAPAAHPPEPHDLLLDGLATWVTEGYAAAVAPLRLALEAFARADDADTAANRWLWVACRTAADLWDHATWEVLATRGLRLARESGALSILPMAGSYRAGAHVHAGRFRAAWALLEEASAVTEAIGTTPLVQAKPIVAAWRGREEEALALVDRGRELAAASGQGMALSMIGHAQAVLMNGLGRYEEAHAAAERACSHGEHSLYANVLVELVEAAVRSDRPRSAADALDRLADRTQASGGDWAIGLEARSRALVTPGPAAEPLYQEALHRLARAHVQPYLARAQLVYGEWLRRQNRRLDARRQLRAAHDTLSRIGAEAFAERARRELTVTGETVRRRTVESRDLLTPQESQVAWLAQKGHTNQEIGAELFVSPRTVEYHLHKVFTKLSIRSRKELATALTDGDGAAAPA
jgi:DNA-binding CsgD family transcriptional regulator/tetratricopeptide (TPR) repeat protein